MRVPSAFYLAVLFLLLFHGLSFSTTYNVNDATGPASRDGLFGDPGGMQDKGEIRLDALVSEVRLPMSFVENRGQLDERVEFLARSPKATVYFCPTEVVFHFSENNALSAPVDGRAVDVREASRNLANSLAAQRKELAVRVSFPEACDNAIPTGTDKQEGKVNVFKGSDPDEWIRDIQTFRGVAYHDLWKGIDLVYRGREGLWPEIRSRCSTRSQSGTCFHALRRPRRTQREFRRGSHHRHGFRADAREEALHLSGHCWKESRGRWGVRREG